ncbi:hypothetical protein BDZ45DRAFT_593729 [Acephala macrosclerotiorum]|nr:hypothetical protein BDZ45DRAFT_593729 [Acephala macrosclerotiorum]
MPKLDRQERLEILNWLTPIDYAPQQTEYIRRRQPGTGQWFLDSEEYQTWLNTNKQTLFCPGIPGAGKTILTSIVVDDLNALFNAEPSIGIAYLYCNFRQRGEQKAKDLLASLLQQLSQKQSPLPDSVKALYYYHKKEDTRPSLDEISKALHSVASIYSRVFIIVDALDECQVSDRCRAKFLSEIFSLQAKTKVNFLATSRPIPDIERKFKGYLSREILASDDDVRRYLGSRMSHLPAFVLRLPQLQEEIMNEITRAVDGMFLLAQLYLSSLEDTTTPNAIRNALKQLSRRPQGSGGDEKLDALTRAYESDMKRIIEQKPGLQLLAVNVLSWITCARRPLITTELQHALAVETSDLELDKDNFREIDDTLSVCAGLVTIDEKSQIVRFVHYTIQEYFERTQSQWFPNAEDYITNICVTYLSFSTFGSGCSITDEEFEGRLQLNQLYRYAAQNWGHHAHEFSSSSSERIMYFLTSEAKIEASAQALMAVGRSSSGYSQQFPRHITGLHLAAYFGLGRIASVLLASGSNPDPIDSHKRTPLSWAAARGHEAVVKLLLETGKVEADSKDGDGWTPLWWAAENKHEAVIKLLLETNKVDITITEGVAKAAAGIESSNDKVMLPLQALVFSPSFCPEPAATRDTRPTATSLGWSPHSQLLNLYKFVVAKQKDPYFELQDGYDPTYQTPRRVFLDYPKYDTLLDQIN